MVNNKIVILFLIILILPLIFFKSKFSNSKIPMVVYQTWKTHESLPKIVLDQMESNKKMCPDFNFVFYSDTDCQSFMEKYFSGPTLDAYNSINSDYSAAKADLFRYCLLYIFGGVYLDIKSGIKKDLKKIIKPDNDCVLFYWGSPRPNAENRHLLHYDSYEQWALIFERGHPYLGKTIEQITHDINNKNIPKGDNKKTIILKLTGPDAFSKAINDYRKENNYLGNESYYNIFDIFNYTPPGYSTDMLYKGKTHYSSGKKNIID